MTDPDILINVTQLARRLGLSRQTVYNRMGKCERNGWDENLLPRSANANSEPYYWSLAEVDRWLAGRPMKRAV